MFIFTLATRLREVAAIIAQPRGSSLCSAMDILDE
jgi:hypothetical protein